MIITSPEEVSRKTLTLKTIGRILFFIVNSLTNILAIIEAEKQGIIHRKIRFGTLNLNTQIFSGSLLHNIDVLYEDGNKESNCIVFFSNMRFLYYKRPYKYY